jgi:hypothetical protein
MKTNILKFSMTIALLILIAASTAFAGGYRYHSPYRHAPAHRAYTHHGGYDHRFYHGWPRHSYYRHYGHPGWKYYHNHYPRGRDHYDGRYYFSGAYAWPGFGFFFGTRSGW